MRSCTPPPSGEALRQTDSTYRTTDSRNDNCGIVLVSRGGAMASQPSGARRPACPHCPAYTRHSLQILFCTLQV